MIKTLLTNILAEKIAFFKKKHPDLLEVQKIADCVFLENSLGKVDRESVLK
jgi:hypothetical protein